MTQKVSSERALGEDLIARLVRRGVTRSYPRNAVIHNEGDPGETLCVVLSGRLKVFVGDSAGHEVLLDTLEPGEYFGTLMLDGRGRSASVMSLTPVTLCVLDRRRVEALIAEEPAFARHVMLKLIRRVRALTGNVRSLALLDVQGRVARLLLDLAREEGGLRVVRPKISQREIARRVGASAAMVNQVFRDLAERGYITVRATSIVVNRVADKVETRNAKAGLRERRASVMIGRN